MPRGRGAQFDSSRPRFRLVSATAQPTAAVRMGILNSRPQR